jgi:hypothetical protein
MSGPDPWRLIDEAEGLDLGPRRTTLLRAAVAALDDLGLDVLQGRAVVLAMIAFDDPSELMRAKEACEVAETAGVPTALPYSHLAEAFLRARACQEALDACARVDTRRLEEIDLHWRVVRIDEIRAACLVRLGRFYEAELAIARVLRELVNESIEEFLPAPVELLDALADSATDPNSQEAKSSQAIISRFANQLPLDSWLPGELTDRIKAVCEQGT